jgi:hypothetical protein
MNVINIGTNIDQLKDHELTNTDLFSNETLLDADIIFWDVKSSYDNFSFKSDKVNEIISERFTYLKGLIEKRKKEFEEFFDLGRTLVIINPFFKDIFFSLNDNSKNETLHINFKDCIGIDDIKYEIVNGKNIVSIDQTQIEAFVNSNIKLLLYNIKYPDNLGTPLMFIKGTDYVVSKFYSVRNGYIIFFPLFRFQANTSEEKSRFVGNFDLLNLGIKQIPKKNEINIPEWVENYILLNESEERTKLEQLKKQQVAILNRINSQELILSEIKSLKALFSTDGGSLEQIVEKIFNILGFKVEKPSNNRDDLIILFDNKIAVVEIKGNINSAAEKHCVQLQKWVTNYHFSKDINPKGILIINTFKNKPIEERTDLNFPDQMLPYAKQMNHCLVSGLQLLCLFLDFKNGNIKIAEVIDLLFNTVGELTYTTDFAKFIKKK